MLPAWSEQRDRQNSSGEMEESESNSKDKCEEARDGCKIEGRTEKAREAATGGGERGSEGVKMRLRVRAA